MDEGDSTIETYKPTVADVGLRLIVEGKKTLTLGRSELSISEPGNKQASRNSCAAFTGNSGSSNSIPFYDLLWAEAADGVLTIDYAHHASSTSLQRKTRTFPLITGDAAPAHQPDAAAFAEILMSKAYGQSKREKRVYVLINPNSGPGGAVRHWQNEVKPLFEAARFKMDIVTLTRGGEATELVEKLDLTQYDTITACSGDGTPYEVFNGLARRPDASRALSTTPVSHIPCGSGNAISGNIFGSHKPSVAALGLIKGVVTPVDLTSITQGDRRTISVLSQSVGIIAEADLDTENMRWMGSKRFEVGLIQRVWQRKCYPCDLAVKMEVEGKDAVRAHYARAMRGEEPPAEASTGEEDAAAAKEGLGLPKLKYGTVQDDLPEGWTLVRREDIGNFWAGNMAYMAPNANFFPAALPSDGCLDLITIKGTLSPITAAKVLMAAETDGFFDNPNVEYNKISAYRIIPRDQKTGCISIDGERIPFEPFQAEVHRGLGRVLTRMKKYEAPGPRGWDRKV